MNYTVIIPAKNEELIIGQTLDILLSQSLKPQCILVIDNDSEDNTSRIIKEYASLHPNVKYFNYQSENSYSLGGKIVKIFHAGKNHIDSLGIEYDYIVKMDADTKMEEDAFEKLSQRLQDQQYGIVSPLAFTLQNGKKVFTSTPDWHTSGDFKIYNRQCLEAMGGLPEDLGWDCADNIRAMEIGYATQVFRDIHYEQTRPIGRYSLLKGWKRQGIGAWKLRYNLAYLLLKSIHDFFKPPLMLGSVYYLSGYLTAFFRRYPRTLTPKQGKILRRLFWKSLFSRLRTGHFYILQRLARNKNTAESIESQQ